MLFLIVLVFCLICSLVLWGLSLILTKRNSYRLVALVIGFFIPFIDIPFLKTYSYVLCRDSGLHVYKTPKREDTYYMNVTKYFGRPFPDGVRYIEYGPDRLGKYYKIDIHSDKPYHALEIESPESIYEYRENLGAGKPILYAFKKINRSQLIERSTGDIFIELVVIMHDTPLGWVTDFLNAPFEGVECPINYKLQYDQFLQYLGEKG